MMKCPSCGNKVKSLSFWKRLLWEMRIWKGIGEVKHLAATYPDDQEYQIENVHDAFDVFCEHSSQSNTIYKTTEQEGELIQMLFLRQWNKANEQKKFSVSPEQVVLTAAVLAFFSALEILLGASWAGVLQGLCITGLVAWQSKSILRLLGVVSSSLKGRRARRKA